MPTKYNALVQSSNQQISKTRVNDDAIDELGEEGKTMLNRARLSGILTALLILFAAVSMVSAAQINGTFSVFGPIVPVDNAGNLVPLNIATGLDFTQGGLTPTPNVPGTLIVGGVSGDFVGALTVFSSQGTITDFTFAGPAGIYPTVGPTLVLESLPSGVTFTLQTVNIENQGLDPNGNPFLTLSGTGIVTLSGFDPTPGVFSISAQGVSHTFSFSASNSATPCTGAIGDYVLERFKSRRPSASEASQLSPTLPCSCGTAINQTLLATTTTDGNGFHVSFHGAVCKYLSGCGFLPSQTWRIMWLLNPTSGAITP